MQYTEILDKFKSLSDLEAIAGMARFGINLESSYGVSIQKVRKIADKEVERGHFPHCAP